MGDREGCFDLLATDGGQLCAGRHAVNINSVPLFYTTDDENFPGAQVIASEPLTDTDFWHSLPDDSILVLDPEQPAELIALTDPREE
jgi:predicted glutamine amidotransferase